jgi:hypothetical protein
MTLIDEFIRYDVKIASQDAMSFIAFPNLLPRCPPPDTPASGHVDGVGEAGRQMRLLAAPLRSLRSAG